MNNINPRTLTKRYLGLLLKIMLLIVCLIIIYASAIYLTNGYGGGGAACGVMLLLIITLIFIFWRHKRLRFLPLYSLILIFALFFLFVVYTIVPVASTGKIRVAPGFKNVKTRYWKLKTGSNIAYYKLDANKSVRHKPLPIIFIHGGPGAYVRQLDINFFSLFTTEGYDVYLYDQAGSGRSALLQKSAYSHTRNVQDFREVLQQIGSKKYIAIGMSYGAALLASASVDLEVSKKLAKIIYAEPGIIMKPSKDPIIPKSPNAGNNDVVMPLRLFIGILLNPRGSFISQNEVINYFNEHGSMVQKLFKGAYPSPDSAKIPIVELNTLNFALNGIIVPEVNEYNKNIAAKFKSHNIPSMLLMGESSYIDRNGPLDLLRVNPNVVRVQYFKGAGHLLWNGLNHNNENVHKSIIEFISDRVPSLPNYPLRKDIPDFVINRK